MLCQKVVSDSAIVRNYYHALRIACNNVMVSLDC